MKLLWCKGHRRSSAFLSQSLIKIGWCLKLTSLVRWRCLHQLHKSWLHSMQWWFTLSKLPHKSHGLFLLITVSSRVNVSWCVFFRVANSLYSQLKSWVFILPSQLLSILLGIKNVSSMKKKINFLFNKWHPWPNWHPKKCISYVFYIKGKIQDTCSVLVYFIWYDNIE